jgi:cytochrome c
MKETNMRNAEIESRQADARARLGRTAFARLAIPCTSPRRTCLAAVVLALVALTSHAQGTGEPARIFQYCAPCHSMEKGVNLTGPSLFGVWGRKAATLSDFHRYSDALKGSGLVWDEKTLDAWIRDPAALVPGTEMRFAGLPDPSVRRALIAYLRVGSGNEKGASKSKPGAESRGSMGGMMGGMGMGGGGLPDLKQAPAPLQVKSIGYCDDTYTLTTADGKTHRFWEFNLRFKTDSSAKGPAKHEPVLVPQGMQCDRAQLVFASPDEMAGSIKHDCKRRGP